MSTAPILRIDPAAPRRRPGAKGHTPSLFPVAPGDPCRADVQQPSASALAPNRSTGAPVEPDHEPVPAPPGHAERLVGMARLAASSPRAQEKRGTEYFLLPVRSLINHCDSPRVPFEWTVNPYRGCEFGCRYCYARYTHEFLELDGGDFEKKIYVKKDAAGLFARDLRLKGITGQHIALGTATDPYQPAEREFGVTRGILEQVAARSGLSVSITTKSDQIVRDIDLLQRIAGRSTLSINVSVTTLRARLARWLEPRAPRPDLRLAAVRKVRDAGLAVGVFAMPVLPMLTDREADLDALARAARDAGAQWFAGQALFLMPAAQRAYFAFLEEKFPRLLRDYQRLYARGSYAPQAYRNAITARVRRIRQKYGLGSRPYAPGPMAQALCAPAHQLTMPFVA